MSEDPYVYPGTRLLRNKIGIKDAVELNKIERLLTTQRATESVPSGDFDLAHLQAIHRHLFADLYDWAGDIRVVEIEKNNQQFMFRQYIETGMADVHRRIVRANYFKGATDKVFADAAGRILGDVNYVHPFRDGNGRTQLLYLKQLSGVAGHFLNLRHIEPAAWIEASRRAHETDYRLMAQTIQAALDLSAASPEPSRKGEKG